VTKWSFIYC